MPESDYMNERQLAFFKERLKQLEQDILANAGETTEHLRKPSSCRTLPTAPRSRKNTRWNCARAIASASCSRRCNSPSPASTAANTAGVRNRRTHRHPRLLARPTATLSLEAQERREMRQKLYGD